MLEPSTSLTLFGLYAIFIIGLVWLTQRRQESSEDFLVMNRSLGLFRGSMSMAVSWIWAPAVFICSLQAYTQGLPGIFWFTVPNILTFFVFAFFAIKLRNIYPEGYTIAQAFRTRLNSPSAHQSALTVSLFYQLGAVIINCVAGATLIQLLSGLPYIYGVLMMGGLSLAYSLISGLRASVISDVAQMLMILVFALIIVPWAIMKSGGISALDAGLGGVSGDYRNLFDPGVAFSFGIATSIGLISGPIADQMFSQRAFAAQKDKLGRIFVYAGLIFGVVPIVLSLLGFLGAAAESAGHLSIQDPQMVGPEVVAHLLPTWALGLFAIMAFAGLTSTLDSAFTAIGSLVSIDISNNKKGSGTRIASARWGMIITAIIGMGISLLQPQLLWIFLIYAALASSLFFPAFLMLFWRKMTGKGATAGIISGFVLGTPLAIYANWTENTDLIVLSAILGLCIAGITSVIVSYLTQNTKVA